MKKLTCILILGLFLLSASAGAAAEPVPSRITRVTLFAGQALVTRAAQVAVQPGPNEILIESNAFAVDPDALWARAYGDGELFSVQFREQPVVEAPQEKVRSVEAQIEGLHKRKNVLGDQRRALEKEERFLDGLVDFARVELPREVQTDFPTAGEMDATLAFLRDAYKKVYEQRHTVDNDVVELDKEIDRLKRELQTIKLPARTARKLIAVVFDAKRAQTVRIEADYLAANASWEPVYRATVPETLDALEVTMFARILQKTGENWPAVQLSLSNVVPLKGVGLPSPASWILDLPRPMLGMVRAKAMPALEEVRQAEADSTAREPEAPVAAAQVKERPLAFEYALAQTLDVESRDKETVVPLFSRNLDGAFLHYAVPRQSPLTFLICRAKADRELLDGVMTVYFGSQYVGKTRLDSKRPGDPFNLNLGADRQVTVRRTQISDRVKETYFGKIERDSVVRSLAYTLTVENLKEQPVRIEVIDSLPVARTDRIEVKDLQLDPAPTVKDYLEREGVMLWELELPARGERTVRMTFDVVHPKDFVPSGL